MSSNADRSSQPTGTQPIPITGMSMEGHHRRHRSASFSSLSSSPPSPLIQTPLSAASYNPSSTTKSSMPSTSPSTSPILTYFAQQSPAKTATAATFPSFKVRSFAPPPVFEEEETQATNAVPKPPLAEHTRRANTISERRFSQQQQQPQVPAVPESTDRATALLRRLSLGGGYRPNNVSPPRGPSPPMNTPATSVDNMGGLPTIAKPKVRPRRATTAQERPRRAPSPMGERILKGHFDGFN